ncbi:HalOD1 output domain-containing protein [Halorubrum rubrum]|uniref:HalOD1 output domain-containing protein n=1 Tax=Halorubrum rubrum TaxID=1126240 RepID=A0ABD5QZP8_9EURY|nr:HalOD1 output domain-containing protein [Halorubrum rubrum]
MSSATTDVSDDGPTSESVHVAHGRDERPPSLAVADAVADLAGVDSDALDEEAGIVLYDHVDPDALDALVTHRSDGDVTLAFTVDEYDVRVDADEAVARPAK